MKRIVLSAAFACLISSIVARAGDDARTEKLRKQIEVLQRQLETAQSDNGDSKVTRIGTPHPRTRVMATTLRMYDLSDLFAIAPSYQAEFPREFGQGARLVFPAAGEDRALVAGAPAGMGGMMGGMGGMGGGMFQVDDKSKASGELKITLNELMSAIRKVVRPDAWGEENNGDSHMTALGTALLVSADEETHAQVNELLNLFRKRWGTLRTISVEASWLWLNDEQVQSLLTGEPAPKNGATTVKAFGLVGDAAWDGLMRKLHSSKEHDSRQLGYRAALTCYNGQVVHVMSDGQRLAVTDVRPIVVPSESGTGGASVALQPEMSVINEGATLQIRPIANVVGKTVVLDIHSRVTVRHDAQQSTAADKPVKPPEKGKGPQVIVPVVDRNLQLLTHRLSTTLRVPVGRRMLVGGMTFEEEPVPGERSLYLFVKCSVQEIRNDQEESAPGVQPKTSPATGSSTDAKSAVEPGISAR